MEDRVCVTDMLLHCKWHTPWLDFPIDVEWEAELLSAGTGKKWTVETLLEAGRRLRMLERSFDVRAGLTRAMDTPPKRFFTTPTPGVFPEDVLDRERFERMKDEYYDIRGWDRATGAPTRQTLEAYGLKEVADDLEKRGKLPLPVAETAMAQVPTLS